MFKISMFNKVMCFVLIVMFYIAFFKCTQTLMTVPSDCVDKMLFLPLIFIAYYAVRASKYFYKAMSARYNCIDVNDNGLVLYGRGVVRLPYSEISYITTEQINIFRGIQFVKIEIICEKTTFSCYINNLYAFEQSLPREVQINDFGSNTFRW